MRLRLLRRASDSEDAASTEIDTAEEIQKIQRGLRRLSLASAHSGEILQAVSTRLDEVQQLVIDSGRTRHAALTLDESEVLWLLDEFERVLEVPDLPSAARKRVESLARGLLDRAGWQAVAIDGGNFDGVDIRIAEYLGEPLTDPITQARIHRVLEQGYRRADGTLMRPGVVVAAARTDGHDVQSTASHAGPR